MNRWIELLPVGLGRLRRRKDPRQFSLRSQGSPLRGSERPPRLLGCFLPQPSPVAFPKAQRDAEGREC